MAKQETQLKVMEALQEEAYKGIVRVDTDTMRKIGVRPGDIVEIEGSRITVGVVDRAYPSDVGQSIIRMDGIVRRNAKTGIGEIVKVRKSDVKEAKLIAVAPAQQGVMIQAHPDIFKRGLLGRAVVKGDIVSIGGTTRRRRTLSGSPFFDDIFNVFEDNFAGSGFGLGSLKFIVVETNPKSQPVIITEDTEIKVNPKAVEIIEESIPDVTYEDIGGLDEEIKKLREMVEVPLRHPEIFKRLGVEPPAGVLLHGPPGTGKTLLAKAVANESDSNFVLINGPEIMNKFYGECVSQDSLIFTNGTGLTTIQEAVENGKAHKIAAINIQKQKTELLPISDTYDKGLQKTLKIYTPHGIIELTPTSKLLVLNELEPEWKFAQDLKISDKVAIANAFPKIKESVPNILDFIRDNVKFSGEWIKELFNLNGTNKQVESILNIKNKKIQDCKYNCCAPAWIIKKLYKPGFIDTFNLSRKGKIPTKITKDLMYLLGLLAGDGHLRYNYKDEGVSTISLTNNNKEIIKEYKRIIKNLFGIEDIKCDGKYGYYFSSRPIGNLLKSMGLPVRNKSKTLTVPHYLISMPKGFIASYLKGLFDTDGHVHLVPSGMQVSYYTSSKQMLVGVKYLLLRLGIQSTFRYKIDGTYELTINDKNSLNLFREKINFNHTKRKENLETLIKTKYTKPIYNRIPLKGFLKKIKEKYKIPNRKLIKLGLNPTVNSITRKQIDNLITLLKQLKEDTLTIDKLEILRDNDIIWSPVKIIRESENKVYDFTVPKDHNFIANGFIVHNSEKRVREIFEEAEKNAPSIIFIDEIDAIASKREETYGELERRVVAQLLAMMDGLKSRGRVVVIAATNRPNAIDPALRRPGRFDRELQIGVPDKKGRLNILKIHTRNMPFSGDVKLKDIAEITHGFVGADLSALAKEAAMNVLRRLLPEMKLREKEPIPRELLDKLIITNEDFKAALKIVRPSAMREVLVEIPNIKWKDIGGLEEVKQQLIESIEWPLKYSNSFKTLGIRPPRGILLYGPPGTGKTLLAKAVANESESNFILVRGPELLNKFVGESEKGIRKIFEKARQTSPTIIFFDEIDSIAPRRGLEIGTKVTERVVNTLLSEMDGLQDLSDIVVIAATNRPDMMDPALLRPGRFDRAILITVPDEKSRLQILKIHTDKMPLAKDVNIESLAKSTVDFVGADIENLCREAAILALRDNLKAKEIPMKYFKEALKKANPSLTQGEMEAYKMIEQKYLKAAKNAALKQEIPNYLG